MSMVMIRKIGTNEYDINKINREGRFVTKPSSRGVWATIGNAKAHVTQFFNDSEHYGMQPFEVYMESEFVIMSDDYTEIETIPMRDFFLEKLKDFVENGPKARWGGSKVKRYAAHKYLCSLGIDVIMMTEEEKAKAEIEKRERAELARLKAKYEKE